MHVYVDHLNIHVLSIHSRVLKEKVSLLAARDGQLSEMESALSVAQKECADANDAILLANKEKQV